MTLDLTPIVQPILAAVGTVLATLTAIYVPKAVAAFEARTGVILTENQRKTVLDAVQTGAGVLETALDKGALKVEHIEVGTSEVTQQAQAVLNAVPNAAAALGLSVDGVARMIVGAVDTGAHGVTTATTTAAAPDQIVTETKQGTTP